MDIYNLVSFGGIFVLLGFAWPISALIAILYYFRVIPIVIRGFSYVFTKLMKISGTESLVAASNIFVGVESALTVKPYMTRMTRSEFYTILTVGIFFTDSSILLGEQTFFVRIIPRCYLLK